MFQGDQTSFFGLSLASSHRALKRMIWCSWWEACRVAGTQTLARSIVLIYLALVHLSGAWARARGAAMREAQATGCAIDYLGFCGVNFNIFRSLRKEKSCAPIATPLKLTHCTHKHNRSLPPTHTQLHLATNTRQVRTHDSRLQPARTPPHRAQQGKHNVTFTRCLGPE